MFKFKGLPHTNLRQTSISFPKACTFFSALHTITISPWVEWRDASYKAETVTDRPASLTCSERYATHLSSLPPMLLPNLNFSVSRHGACLGDDFPRPSPHPHQSPPATTCNHPRLLQPGCPISRITRSQEKPFCSCIHHQGPAGATKIHFNQSRSPHTIISHRRSMDFCTLTRGVGRRLVLGVDCALSWRQTTYRQQMALAARHSCVGWRRGF